MTQLAGESSRSVRVRCGRAQAASVKGERRVLTLRVQTHIAYKTRRVNTLRSPFRFLLRLRRRLRRCHLQVTVKRLGTAKDVELQRIERVQLLVVENVVDVVVGHGFP